MLSAVLVIVGLAALCSVALAVVAGSERGDERMIDRIDDLLPQTQCGRCTYAGCRPYAAAIARGEADINQCPPGGMQTVAALASLLGRTPRPVDPRFGIVPSTPAVAWIDEPACIGCTKCIQACPVDAIVGASTLMHTVIAEQCTGCELCIPPCPVDCIEMRPARTQ
jgi:electron transport complex protein RnfB